MADFSGFQKCNGFGPARCCRLILWLANKGLHSRKWIAPNPCCARKFSVGCVNGVLAERRSEIFQRRKRRNFWLSDQRFVFLECLKLSETGV